MKSIFKKHRGGKNNGFSTSGFKLSFGIFGFKAFERGEINSKQIESCRRILSKYTKKSGNFWIRVFPNISVTKKPIETRMGSGKGDIYDYICFIKPGRILYELNNVSEILAKKIFKLVSYKLSFKIIFIKI